MPYAVNRIHRSLVPLLRASRRGRTRCACVRIRAPGRVRTPSRSGHRTRAEPLMAFVIGAGNWLSNGSVRFVTHRTAWAIALGAACGAAVLALAGGVVIGRHWPVQETPGAPGDTRIEHDYAIDQLGQLSASVAQIEPRIARLTAQVDGLRNFEARLNTPRPAPRAPAAPSAPITP